MDGRTQDAVKNYMIEHYHTEYVDMVTEPGPNKILADNINIHIVENIKKRVEISVHHHGAKYVAIVGHFGCACNPAEKEGQVTHLKEAKKTIESFGFDIQMILLWIGSDFKTVEKIQ